jgi:hypothetical protein
VDVDLFAECRTFNEAYKLALRHIGSEIDDDAPPLIETEPEDGV